MEVKDIEERQEIFLDIFFEEVSQGVHYWTAVKTAKLAAGYSPNTRNTQIVSSLKKKIIERCQEIQVLSLPKAVLKTESVLDDPTQLGARRVLEAATIIMDRAGLIKKDHIELDIKAPDGILVLPMKNNDNKDN